MRQGGSEQELRLGESWDRSDLAVNPQRLPEEEAQHPTRDACNGNRSPTRGGGPLPPHSPDGGAAAEPPGPQRWVPPSRGEVERRDASL